MLIGNLFSSSEENDEDVTPNLIVNRNLELPEGATLSDSDSSRGNLDDPHRALDIDLELLVILYYEDGRTLLFLFLHKKIFCF